VAQLVAINQLSLNLGFKEGDFISPSFFV